MKQKNTTKRYSQKGITLIALIITIVVLLILAGVTIAAITSNESSPNKAVEAREANIASAEYDAIRLAAMSSVAEGELNLNVDRPTLKKSLEGIVTNPETIINTEAPWIVVGDETGNYYIISLQGKAELVDGVVFTSKNVKVKQGKSLEVEVINITGEELNIETEPASSTGVTITKVTNNVTITTTNQAVIGTKITITATAGTESDTCEVEIIDSPKRGDYIILNSRAITGVGPANTDNTSNTSNADDWMILYNGLDETEDDDKKGLFVIMANYLPNAYKANYNETDGVAKKAGLSYSTINNVNYGVNCASGAYQFMIRLKPTD